MVVEWYSIVKKERKQDRPGQGGLDKKVARAKLEVLREPLSHKYSQRIQETTEQ